MKQIKLTDLVDSVIDCLTELDGGHAVGNGDIRDACLELNEIKALFIHGVMHWVAVKDRLPSKEGTYLTWNGKKIIICEFEPIYKEFIGNTANGVNDAVIFWNNLPEPPCA